MLVITRKAQEGFWVGDIHVQINQIRGNRVKVSIDAPPSVPIRRDELQPLDPPAEQRDPPGD